MAGERLILLCGGKSERMGTPKGLLEFRGHTWLEEQLGRFAAAGGSEGGDGPGNTGREEPIARFPALVGREAVVGLGHHAGRYLEVLSPLLRGERTGAEALRLRVALNPDPERGPFSTLWTALRESPGRAAFVLPIDVPLVPEVLPLLVSRDAYAAIPTHEGRGGHPVWLSEEAVRDVLAQDPATQRLDVFLRERAERVRRFPVSAPDVTLNLNSPDRWAEFLSRR